jgi:hypothetical protein
MTSGRITQAAKLPKGTLSMTKAVVAFRVPEALITRHIAQGHIEVTEFGGRMRRTYRYFTPDQQRKAMAYWDTAGVKYRKPAEAVPAEKVEASS